MLFNNLAFLLGLFFYTWFGYFLKRCLATLSVTCLCSCRRSSEHEWAASSSLHDTRI